MLSRLLSGGLSLVGGRPVGRLSLVGGRLSVGGLLVAGCDLAHAANCRPKTPIFFVRHTRDQGCRGGDKLERGRSSSKTSPPVPLAISWEAGGLTSLHRCVRCVARRSGTTLTREPTFARCYLAENVFKRPVRVHLLSLLHGLALTTVLRCRNAREPPAANPNSTRPREAQTDSTSSAAKQAVLGSI